nr:katanin p80 WD40 repeat-containing subunit B1 homolog isoform X1 [Tanacetum cinerariifolium]
MVTEKAKSSPLLVQADVVTISTERMESFTLKHFSSLLSVLLELLNSMTERGLGTMAANAGTNHSFPLAHHTITGVIADRLPAHA